MTGSVLKFLLLVLGILFILSLDIGYKYNRFFKTLSEKSFEFIWSKGDNTIVFNLSLVLLLIKVDHVPEKQSYKQDALIFFTISYTIMVFAVLTKIVVLYLQTFIV